MSVAEKFKHAMFEETATPTKKVPAGRFIPSVAMPVTPLIVITGSAATISFSSDQYEKMRANTDFDTTDVGAALKQFSAPLDGIITDEKQKFQAVLALAHAFPPAKILSTFDDLIAKIAGMQTEFNSATEEFKREEIDGHQASLNIIMSEIAKKQQELAIAKCALQDAQDKLQSTTLEFTTALAKRTEELKSQKSHYASLMKG